MVPAGVPPRFLGPSRLHGPILELMRSLGAAILLVTSLAGCGERGSVEAFQSFDLGATRLELRASAGWAFSSHVVHVYEMRGDQARFMGSMELANDGAVLGEGNAQLVPVGEGEWDLKLSGQEQPEQVWRVERAGSRLTLIPPQG